MYGKQRQTSPKTKWQVAKTVFDPLASAMKDVKRHKEEVKSGKRQPKTTAQKMRDRGQKPSNTGR